MSICDACRDRFQGSESDKELALRLYTEFPNGDCERCSVGNDTSGFVGDGEGLIRIMVDPRDIDDGRIMEAPFKAAFVNGLSVLRSTATDADCVDQTLEGMYRKSPEDDPREVMLVCESSVSVVRQHKLDGIRSFFVYDQTVPRTHTQGAPIQGHVGVFGRVMPKGTEGRHALTRDLAGELKSLITQGQISPENFRSSLLLGLNQRSADGEFTLESGPAG